MCKETSVRSAALAIVLVFLCLPLFAAGDDSPCAQTAIPGLNSLELRANAGQQATKEMPNPLKGKAECVPTVCWLAGDQLASRWMCKEARNPRDEVTVFSIGVLGAPVSTSVETPTTGGSGTSGGTQKAGVSGTSASTKKGKEQGTTGENRPYTALKTSEPDEALTKKESESLVITYKPRGASGQQDQAYLQVEWRKDRNSERADHTDTYFIKGVVTTGEGAKGVVTTGEGNDQPCGDTAIPGLNSLELRASAGQQATEVKRNPLMGKTGCIPTVCWLTVGQLAARKTCKDVHTPSDEVKAFSIGVLGVPVTTSPPAPAAGGSGESRTQGPGAPGSSPGTKKGSTEDAATANRTYTALKIAEPDEALINEDNESLVITYKPTAGSGHQDEADLQVEWRKDPKNETADHTDTYLIKGVVTTAEDERYRLSLYAGGAYLYSHQNFGQAFPELRLIVETDYYDGRLRRDHCKQLPRPSDCVDYRLPKETKRWFVTVRGYGDMGLTSTSAVASSEAALAAKSFSGSKSFDGHFGLGVGGTAELATKSPDSDLSRLLLLFVARIGLTSIPDVPADLKARMGPLPFNDSFGFRVENAGGRYRGAYFELGFGQSNEYVYQKTNRLKADAFLPFNQPNTVRMAARLQIDRPSPIGSLNNLAHIPNGSTTTANERRGAGDIRIGLLLSIDIGQVFDLMGAASKVK